jgi:hypothetical protein
LHWNPWNKRSICKKGLARPCDGRHVGHDGVPAGGEDSGQGEGGLTPPTRSRESTRQGNAGLVAGGQSGRRTGAAAVAAHRRSRRWDGEHGPRRGARALVDHRGTICLPGRVGGQAREAVDDELKSGGAGEQWLGASEIPAEGRSGLIWLGLRSKRRGWGVYW